VGEHGVEVGLGAEVEDLRIVRVIEVRKYAQELEVDLLDCRGEGVFVEALTCGASTQASCRKTEGHALDFVGKTFSSSRRFWMVDMTESMYVGAERGTFLRSCIHI
jgi:hypothetical protein